MFTLRSQALVAVALLFPMAACSKPLPAEVEPLVDSSATRSLIDSVRDLGLCEQVYGIGATYIAALAIVGQTRNPLSDLSAFEAQLREASMPGRDGPWKPCETSLQPYRDFALRPMARVLVAGDRKEDVSPLLSELSKSDFQKDFVAEMYAVLGERDRAVELAGQVRGEARPQALLKVVIALLRRGDVAGAQQMLAALPSSADRGLVESVTKAAQGNWADAWTLSQTASGSVKDEIQEFFSSLLSKDGGGAEGLKVAKAILSTKRNSCDQQLVSLLVRSGQTQEALSIVSVKQARERLSCMAVIVPELLKNGRRDDVDSLVAEARTLGGKDAGVAAAVFLTAAGHEGEADAIVKKAIAATEEPGTDIGERFERFLDKTILASDLRRAGLSSTSVPELLKGAARLAADPGRCNMLTGVSSQYAAIGRYGDAATVVKECTDKGNQAWRVFAHALALVEYARQTNPVFGARLTRIDEATLGADFRLNSVYGMAY